MSMQSLHVLAALLLLTIVVRCARIKAEYTFDLLEAPWSTGSSGNGPGLTKTAVTPADKIIFTWASGNHNFVVLDSTASTSCSNPMLATPSSTAMTTCAAGTAACEYLVQGQHIGKKLMHTSTTSLCPTGVYHETTVVSGMSVHWGGSAPSTYLSVTQAPFTAGGLYPYSASDISPITIAAGESIIIGWLDDGGNAAYTSTLTSTQYNCETAAPDATALLPNLVTKYPSNDVNSFATYTARYGDGDIAFLWFFDSSQSGGVATGCGNGNVSACGTCFVCLFVCCHLCVTVCCHLCLCAARRN
jgi:hypothetical protein